MGVSRVGFSGIVIVSVCIYLVLGVFSDIVCIVSGVFSIVVV